VRKAQGARSRGEPRRCSKRHSRGAHNNQTAHRSPHKNTQRREQKTVASEQNTSERQKTSPPLPWGGRLRAHAFGENPEGALRDTPAGRTTTKQRTGAPTKTRNAGSRQQSRPNRTPQKDRKLAHHSPGAEGFRAHAFGENPEGAPRDTPAGHTTTKQRTGAPPKTRRRREQKTVASEQNTSERQKTSPHQSPGMEGSGRTLSGEPRRCSMRPSRGSHNNQTRRRIQGAKQEQVQDTPTCHTQYTMI